MNLTKPKAVLFDWDNTLADTWPTIHQSLNATLEAFGKESWSLEKTKQDVHRAMRDSFPVIFGDEWEKAGQFYQQHFRSIHLENIVMLPGAHEMIQNLVSKDNVYVALVSNKTGDNLRKEVKHVGFDSYFKKVIGATDAEQDKPSVHPIHMALDGSGLIPNADVWLIGDSVTDMECAHNSGCVPIFYGDGDLSHPHFNDVQPEWHVRDHKELDALINKIFA